MSALVYRICVLLALVLTRVPVGTNLGLFSLLMALLSGRFLAARGAVFPALASLGLNEAAVRRSDAALCYGHWQTQDLLANWQKAVAQEGRFVPCDYEGIQPVAADLTAFFRPQLRRVDSKPLDSKHFLSRAGKALPAVVLGVCAAVGRVGTTRLGLPRLLLRRETDETEAALQKRLVAQATQALAPAEALIVDAGFSLPALLGAALPHCTLWRVCAPKSPPAAAATPPDATACWTDGQHRLLAEVWDALVLPEVKPQAEPDTPTFRLVAIYDPRYPQPLLLASNLEVSACALWRLYRDRWAIEQLPLSAKPMLGAERAFVFGAESRYRLPELALLAGNVLSYVAATSAPVASGFWDRAARPTCGRMRRSLARIHSSDIHYSELPCPEGQLRKKQSVTAHLKTGVEGHRRQKAVPTPSETAQGT